MPATLCSGDARPDSDIDLLVVVPDSAHAASAQRLAWQAIGAHAVPIDLVLVRRATFASRRAVPWSLIATALREGTPLR